MEGGSAHRHNHHHLGGGGGGHDRSEYDADDTNAADDDNLEVAIARANAAREATRVEYQRLELAMRNREASRARVIRDALATAPALAEELRARGVLDNDSEMARLAVQIMSAPLHDPTPPSTAAADATPPPPPGALSRQPRMGTDDASVAAAAAEAADAKADADATAAAARASTSYGGGGGGRAGPVDEVGVLRDMHVTRAGDFAAVEGELAAKRQQLEARQRDLLRAGVSTHILRTHLTHSLVLIRSLVLKKRSSAQLREPRDYSYCRLTIRCRADIGCEGWKQTRVKARLWWSLRSGRDLGRGSGTG